MKTYYKNSIKTLIGLFALFFITVTTGQTKEDLKIISAAQEAKTLFIQGNPELAELILEAHAYIIFPELKVGTYALEGVAGHGAVYKEGKLIGTSLVTQADSGIDLQGNSYRELVLIKNETQFNRLKDGSLKLVTDRHGVMVEKGETKSIQFKDGLTVVTMPQDGAQIDISIAGQSFTLNKF